MNGQNRSIFPQIENYLDMLINITAIYIGFFFNCIFIGEPPFNIGEPSYVISILVAVIIISFFYQTLNTYKKHIYIKAYIAIVNIIKANLIVFGAVVLGFTFFANDASRYFLIMWTLFSFIFSTAFLLFKRNIVLSIVKALYKKQYILRKVIIVGDNIASAKEFIHQVTTNPQYGLMVIGYVGNKTDPELACDKLGTFKELGAVIDEHRPTDIVFAIDAYDKRHLIRLVNICDDKCVKVYFLPVIYGFFKSEKQIEKVGSMPVINIHSTPLDNRANATLKRTVDIIGSLALIILTSPLMLAAAIGTKITSPGPVLFKQERVGKMGVPFTMLKFRTMRDDSRHDEWTTPNDTRKTKFGTFLRRTAIDELPQLFNVLMGSMSLVGPRPEMTTFVNKFREIIPLYMIKHYVKPGMTGLAQIRGLRGDTSIEERIHTDISYIENWTFMLDISILFRTPFKAFNKNEKYIGSDSSETNPELAYGPSDPETQEIHELLVGEENESLEAVGEAANALDMSEIDARNGGKELMPEPSIAPSETDSAAKTDNDTAANTVDTGRNTSGEEEA